MNTLRDRPEVETQREGWCVANKHCDLLFSGYMTSTGPQWVRPDKAKVFATHSSAAFQAITIDGVVSTVPRFNGVCFEWKENV